MAKNYLFSYSGNWADEMDILDTRVLNEEEYNKFEGALKGCHGFTMIVGSNQEIKYNSQDDVENAYSVQEITEEELAVLQKFGFVNNHRYWGPAQKFISNVLDSSDC